MTEIKINGMTVADETYDAMSNLFEKCHNYLCRGMSIDEVIDEIQGAVTDSLNNFVGEYGEDGEYV